MKFEALPFREQYDLLRKRSVDNKFKLGTCLSREKKAAVGKFHMLCDVAKPCKASKLNTNVGLIVQGRMFKFEVNSFTPSCDAWPACQEVALARKSFESCTYHTRIKAKINFKEIHCKANVFWYC
jgi:hypothetical protein